jgi:sec-independent protein translocase protein TatA
MPNLGFPELVLILGIALLLFGANRIPDIARSMGSAVNEFKKALAGDGEERGGGRKGGKS